MGGTALRARVGRALDVLVVAALGVLVVFPVLAYRAAGRQPVAPPPVPPLDGGAFERSPMAWALDVALLALAMIVLVGVL